MLLLHLSDIHFRHPECDGGTDPGQPYRTTLLRDARDRAQALGGVDAILITGDIAFRGSPEEYRAAHSWLQEIASACGCSQERIYVVPGNHDIDRSVVAKSTATRNVHNAIANAAPENRERELRAQIQDKSTADALLAPAGAYNEFAAAHNCQVYLPERLYWTEDLDLDNSIKLRLHGLTSTLLSGAGGADDSKAKLYLSPLQTVLNPVDDVVNLVMSHHPPSWFMDEDDVDDAVRGRAEIQLFGHRHRQRHEFTREYARMHAAAVNPDRREPAWEPGYNLIELSVQQDESHAKKLKLSAHLLVWQTAPDMFRPKQSPDGEFVFSHELPIRCSPNPSPRTEADTSPREESIATDASPDSGQEAMMSDDRSRNLILRFWSLTSSQRREITQGLGLISDEDLALPEPERYHRALVRAAEQNQLEELAKEVDRMGGENGN